MWAAAPGQLLSFPLISRPDRERSGERIGLGGQEGR